MGRIGDLAGAQVDGGGRAHSGARRIRALFRRADEPSLPAAMSRDELAHVALFAASVLLFAPAALRAVLHEPAGNNMYAWLADAWLNGRLHIWQELDDIAVFNGQLHVAFPPAPALLFLPSCLLLGPGAPVAVAMALLLFAASTVVWSRLLEIFGVSGASRFTCLAAFMFATPLFYAAIASRGVWFFAHLVAFTCASLALLEFHSRRRGWIVGLLLAVSFLSRQMTILFALYFAALIVLGEGAPLRRRAHALATLLMPIVLAVAAYLAYNHARFGDPLETGYSFIELRHEFLDRRVERYGLFDVAYLQFNFWHFFLEGPHADLQGDMKLELGDLSLFGAALPLISPFVLLAMRARRSLDTLSAWAAILAIAAPTLLYYNNGWMQVGGPRFALDFLPFLFMLVARGVARDGIGPFVPLALYGIGVHGALIYFRPLRALF
jgi:hypothetical protein